MATYRGTFGQKIQYIASDPSPLIEGQVWYNSTSNTLKIATQVATTQAWTTVPSMGTGRYGHAMTGSQTATIASCGSTGPGAGGTTSVTELYNGSSWTASTNNPTGRKSTDGVGTQTAAMVFLGQVPGPTGNVNVTTLWNGSSWTSLAGVSTPRGFAFGAGEAYTASVIAGGETNSQATEEFNGTAWTGGGNLNTGRWGMGMAGIQTLALGFGGGNPGSVTNTEGYNGSAWTNLTAMNVARYRATNFGATQDSAVSAGSPGAGTEVWSGSSWATGTSMNTSRSPGSGSGSGAAGLGSGNYPANGVTEEWTGATNYVGAKTVTTS